MVTVLSYTRSSNPQGYSCRAPIQRSMRKPRNLIVRLMPRTYCIEVERTVTYRRWVWVQVDEIDERLQDEKKRKDSLKFDAQDAAIEKAEREVLTGWEPHGAVEYDHVSAKQVESAPNVTI
jgi:hypothetical protein